MWEPPAYHLAFAAIYAIILVRRTAGIHTRVFICVRHSAYLTEFRFHCHLFGAGTSGRMACGGLFEFIRKGNTLRVMLVTVNPKKSLLRFQPMSKTVVEFCRYYVKLSL